MRSTSSLKNHLKRIDGKGYNAYKNIKGVYEYPDFTLFIDHVQGDPYAAPSKIRVRVNMQKAKFPTNLFENEIRKLGLEDVLIRKIDKMIKKIALMNRGTEKSGLFTIDAGGQEILERTAFKVTKNWLEARMEIALPAKGRTISGRHAIDMFFIELPEIIRFSMFWETAQKDEMILFIESLENQESLRKQLNEKKLVAFVTNGAMLPRASGASDKPLDFSTVVSFQSPPEMEVEMDLLNPVDSKNQINGMGIPEGITLIVGGGFHGKSTLLQAVEKGVYPHIPNDGREYVVTRNDGVKIRAEDGRRVEKVDLKPFISHLPLGKNIEEFASDNASGSTSQAANILEALEIGSRLLLVDEDTSATNFMVRDARMQALVHKGDEPITPFVDRIGELYEKFKVSTILVMGGNGDYFDTADHVIMMKEYKTFEVTAQAKTIMEKFRTKRNIEKEGEFDRIKRRIPLAESINPAKGKYPVKVDARGLNTIQFGRNNIDLHYVEQLMDISQTRAIAYAMVLAVQKIMLEGKSLINVCEEVLDYLKKNGLESLNSIVKKGEHPGNFALPRKFEIAAAINRLRTVKMKLE